MKRKICVRSMFLGAVIMLIGLAVGAIVSPPLIAQRNGMFDEIQCKRLTVVDEDGNKAIGLFSTGVLVKENMMVVYDKLGNEVIVLKSQMWDTDRDHPGKLGYRNLMSMSSSDTQRVGISLECSTHWNRIDVEEHNVVVSPYSAMGLASGKGGNRMWLSNSEGIPVIELEAIKESSHGLIVRDYKGIRPLAWAVHSNEEGNVLWRWSRGKRNPAWTEW